MYPIEIALVVQEARALRAQETQRVQGLFSARLRVYAQLLGATALTALAVIGESLRPLFSWNPKTHRPS
ncbi:MAG: hypothetical protein D4R84_01500 [Rhodocyclaceae bacterium]|nr:MAG: hypothetical protein D4R84_01500 [Rhodocyclaceae bacterium]